MLVYWSLDDLLMVKSIL